MSATATLRSPYDLRVQLVQDTISTGGIGLVALLDLDGFKQVNDTHGHDVGDELLRAIADRLASIATTGGLFAARLSGDEFLLLWDQAPTDPVDQVRHLLARIAEPCDVAGTRVTVGVSVGIALAGEHLHGTSLLRAADAAMYRAKHGTQKRSSDTAIPAGLRIHLWNDDRPPAPTDRRSRRDVLLSPTLTDNPNSATSSTSFSVVTEGTR